MAPPQLQYKRSELHAVLLELVGEGGHVYFQPRENDEMAYPCVVYSRDQLHADYADNSIYRHKVRYQVTSITADPDSDLPEKLAALPLSSFNRFFVADNLNHDVFNLFY